MKKGIITVFVTLFIFFSSTVGVFAQEVTQNSWSVDAQYWLYDLMLQSTVGRNMLAGDWGYAEGNNGTGTFMFQLNAGYDVAYKYNVPAGETVYFRWSIPMFSAHEGQTITVKTLVNGTQIDYNQYSRTSIGSTGSMGAITMIEDYTNTTNQVQMVEFYILNNHQDFGLQLIPILCGTKYYFNDVVSGPVNGSDTVNIDLTFIQQTLDNIFANQVTSSEFLDEIGNVQGYLGDLNTSVQLNGQYLDNIDSVLTSIKPKIDSIDITLSDIKLFISYIRADVKDIRNWVNFIMTDVDEINITTKQMASTLTDIKNLLDELVNGFDSSKKDNLDSSNHSLSDTISSHQSFESSMFDTINGTISSLPSINPNENMDFAVGLFMIGDLMKGIFNTHPTLVFFFNIIFTFGLTFVLIGRGTRR